MTNHEARFRPSPFLVEPTAARPRLHLTPPKNWMNDPNGPIFADGLWHLYYQHHPDGMTWGPMHWGHATSRDLLHWEHAPIALLPDAHGTIFSGCIVSDPENTCDLFKPGFRDGLVALYSYDNQEQGLATSTDGGLSWTSYAGNPILPAVKENFRDPKVFWCEQSQRWIMAIAADPECQFYSSDNLIDWTLQSGFSDGPSKGVWEVPDLFPLTAPDGSTKWVLMISIDDHAYAGGSGILYFLGQWDGGCFVNDVPGQYHWLDHGPDNYAGTTFANAPEGRRVYVGWMLNWVYANKTPQLDYRGTMTLPRDMFLIETAEGHRIGTRPAGTLEAALPERQTLALKLAAEGRERLTLSARTFALHLQCAFLEGPLTLTLDGSPNVKQATTLVFDPSDQALTARRFAGVEEMFETARLPMFQSTSTLDVLIVVDEGLIEVFDQSTGQSLSLVTFSGQRDSGTLDLQSAGECALTVLVNR